MVSVLYIGYYNKDGKFNTIQWRSFIEWCKTECNKIIVYSSMPYDTISSKFPLYCDVKELEMPDELMRVYAYEINVIEVAFWNYVLIEEPINQKDKFLSNEKLILDNIQ